MAHSFYAVRQWGDSRNHDLHDMMMFTRSLKPPGADGVPGGGAMIAIATFQARACVGRGGLE